MIKSLKDFQSKLSRAKSRYDKRNKMANLVDEMYFLKKERNSGYLDSTVTSWRDRVGHEYWEASSKPHNVIDVMTAVLSGHRPQYHCVIPGDTSSTIPSRAELFIDGVWRLNSRRQQCDLVYEFFLNTVKYGGAGLRFYWMPDPVPVQPRTVPNPDNPQEEWVVQTHNDETFPLCMEVLDIRNLYPGRRGKHGKPFSEIFYTQKRTIGAVVEEWEETVDLKEHIKGVQERDWDNTEYEYTEWWGQDRQGLVWYAITYNQKWLVEPTVTPYPKIPFVVSAYKLGKKNDASHERLPFIFPIFASNEKYEYIRSRAHRQIDMFSNMNPYHAGETPIDMMDQSWGKIIELNPKEDIRFPQWPGNPPDVYKELQTLEADIAEGSFSRAMFGEVSTRMSGYAMSQVIGADTLRTDIPRINLELALAGAADLIFGIMQVFSPNIHLAVTADIKHRKMAAMLSGQEALGLVVESFVKPKQTSDEVRLATLGSQIASMPNPPVSMRYVLEHYFGVNQPEEELNRKLDEDAMKDPIIRMMAMMEVLQEAGSPYASVLMGQLQQAVGAATQQQGGGPGMGLPQAVGGNPPIIPASGNPSEEVGLTDEAALYGGPREEV